MTLRTNYTAGPAESEHTYDALNTTNTAVNTNTTDVAARITAATLTTKGDLLGRSSTVPARVPVGTDGLFLMADSTQTTGVSWSTPAGGGGGGVTASPYPAVLVASNDATTALKAAADYVCDGVNDQVEIQSAIDHAAALNSRDSTQPAAAQQRGKVQLTGGRFIISGSAGIKMRTGVFLQGMGILTELRASSCTAVGVIGLASANEHLTMVSDLYLYGNYASGGACSGVGYDMTGSTGTGNYPTSSPDAYHWVRDLFIDGFSGTGTRHGIYFLASSGGNNRGNMIDRCQIRNVNGNGIYLNNSSDGFISNCHIGTVAGSGCYVSGGNWKISNCKTFYCDTNGFYLSSGRGTIAGCESQDNFTGFYFDAAPYVASAITADTSSDSGIRVSSNNVNVSGFQIFVRSGGRYSTQSKGLYYDSTYTGLNLLGTVEAANITTAISGSAGSNSTVNVNTN